MTRRTGKASLLRSGMTSAQRKVYRKIERAEKNRRLDIFTPFLCKALEGEEFGKDDPVVEYVRAWQGDEPMSSVVSVKCDGGISGEFFLKLHELATIHEMCVNLSASELGNDFHDRDMIVTFSPVLPEDVVAALRDRAIRDAPDDRDDDLDDDREY